MELKEIAVEYDGVYFELSLFGVLNGFNSDLNSLNCYVKKDQYDKGTLIYYSTSLKTLLKMFKSNAELLSRIDMVRCTIHGGFEDDGNTRKKIDGCWFSSVRSKTTIELFEKRVESENGPLVVPNKNMSGGYYDIYAIYDEIKKYFAQYETIRNKFMAEHSSYKIKECFYKYSFGKLKFDMK